MKEAKIAIIISILLCFPSTILFSFAPVYSEILMVPSIPIDELRQLGEVKALEYYSTPDGLRAISGYEKAIYLLAAEPLLYAKKSLAMFVVIFVAAFTSALSTTCRQKHNKKLQPTADASDL